MKYLSLKKENENRRERLARMKAGAPPHGRERGNLSVEGQMRGRASPYGWERACVGKLIESGYGNAPRVEKGVSIP